MGDDAEIVGDEDIGEAHLILQLLQEVEDLGLDGDIEGGDRFVGDDEIGLADEGACDADALALAAAEGMGVTAHDLGGEANETEGVGDAILKFCPPGQTHGAQGGADEFQDGHAGVEGGVRVLKDHAHVSAHLVELLVVELGHIDATEVWVAEEDGALGGGDGAQDHATGGCFAAAAFAHEPQSFAFVHLQADIVDGFDVADSALEEAAADWEVLLEIVDLKKRGWRWGRGGVSVFA